MVELCKNKKVVDIYGHSVYNMLIVDLVYAFIDPRIKAKYAK